MSINNEEMIRNTAEALEAELLADIQSGNMVVLDEHDNPINNMIHNEVKQPKRDMNDDLLTNQNNIYKDFKDFRTEEEVMKEINKDESISTTYNETPVVSNHEEAKDNLSINRYKNIEPQNPATNETDVNELFAQPIKKMEEIKENVNNIQKVDKVNTTEEIKEEPKKELTPEEFLADLKVDLNNIELVEENPLTDIKNFNFFLNRKSKTQIVAIQSGYTAAVEGFDYSQINQLVNSTLDEYAMQLLLMQTIYSTINTTSVGKLSFDEWCNITSYYDLESFEYANYLETFPGDTSFSIECGSCRQVINAKINNDRLICAKNDLTMERMNEILNNRNNPKEMLNKALVHTKKRVFLEDSKIIIDIKLPTIKKHLDLLSSVNAKAKEKARHILTLMLFFDGVYMLDIQETMAKKKPCYYKVEDRQKIATIIGKLTYNDSKHLSTIINEFIESQTVEFKIKSFVCPSCQTKIRDIPVEIEQLLFFQMQR